MEEFLNERQPVIKCIAEDITLECFSNGIEIDLKYVEYYIRSILMNPDYVIIEEGKIAIINRDILINKGVRFFSKRFSPDLATLKIQTLYYYDYSNDDKVIKDHNKLLFTYIEPLMQFVINYKVANDEGNNEILHRKIVLLVGLLTGMGNPSEKHEFEEIMAAVNSIISPDELESFGHLAPHAKREQVLKLSQIVAGIRLQNKHKLKGGAEIVDLPKLVKDSVNATVRRLQRFNNDYREKVDYLTYSMINYYKWDDEVSDILICGNEDGPYNEATLNIAKYVLLMLYQMLVFTRKFSRKTQHIGHEGEKLEEDMTNCLLITQKIMDLRSIVPVEKIYPRFYKLSLYWNRFQNMVTLLSFYNTMIKSMDKIAKECISKLDEVIITHMKEFSIDEESTVSEYREVIDPKSLSSECTVIFPDENLCAEVKLEFNGICPVFCNECDGMLYEADRLIGVIKFKDKYYGFKDCQAAATFGSDPEWYLIKILDYARTDIFYMDFLGVRKLLLKLSVGVVLLTLEDQFGYTEATQTDLHPIPELIDKNYKSNIWEWRKDLCHWATLYYYRTHSTQTDISLFKSSLPVQTVAEKDASVQTMPENYTQTPIPSSYFYGLRGRTYYPQSHLITLTRPVEEPPNDIID